MWDDVVLLKGVSTEAPARRKRHFKRYARCRWPLCGSYLSIYLPMPPRGSCRWLLKPLSVPGGGIADSYLGISQMP